MSRRSTHTDTKSTAENSLWVYMILLWICSGCNEHATIKWRQQYENGYEFSLPPSVCVCARRQSNKHPTPQPQHKLSTNFNKLYWERLGVFVITNIVLLFSFSNGSSESSEFSCRYFEKCSTLKRPIGLKCEMLVSMAKMKPLGVNISPQESSEQMLFYATYWFLSSGVPVKVDLAGC